MAKPTGLLSGLLLTIMFSFALSYEEIPEEFGKKITGIMSSVGEDGFIEGICQLG